MQFFAAKERGLAMGENTDKKEDTGIVKWFKSQHVAVQVGMGVVAAAGVVAVLVVAAPAEAGSAIAAVSFAGMQAMIAWGSAADEVAKNTKI